MGCAGDDYQLGTLVEPVEILDVGKGNGIVLLAVEDQNRNIIGGQGDVPGHLLIKVVGHIKRPGSGDGEAVQSTEGFSGQMYHGQQGVVHSQRRCLHHQADTAGQIQQILQAQQGDVSAEAAGENAKILYLGIGCLGVLCHSQQGIHAVGHGEEIAVHRAFAVGGEVKTHRGGREECHFLRKVFLDGVIHTAGETVNAQNNTAHVAVIRMAQAAGNLQLALGQDKGFFHGHHPVKKNGNILTDMSTVFNCRISEFLGKMGRNEAAPTNTAYHRIPFYVNFFLQKNGVFSHMHD